MASQGHQLLVSYHEGSSHLMAGLECLQSNRDGVLAAQGGQGVTGPSAAGQLP